MSTKPKVLLVGWDAADWKLIKPLLEAGEVPAIERLVQTGVMGNLATLQPVLSPMLWNSIATGKRPQKHGILGFTEINPHTNTVSPALSTSRKVKALWNILSQEGHRAHVVNWFASHPAEKINGVCISEFFSRMPHDYEAPWPLNADTIHPTRELETYRDLRLHPKELDGEILQLFCPLAHEIDQTKDRRIQVLANLIAEAISVHGAVTQILEHEDWDFVAVYYGSIDHFCHAFMAYHPPKMHDVSEQDFERFRDVVPNAYRFHDRMLARLLDLAGEDATVIVCSDHGFHSDHLRPHGTPAVPAGPAYWHRDQGILMMRGPNIVQDELVHGASLLDITPTILQVFGLPLGRDMDGRPLLEAFREVDHIDTIDSWEQRTGDHPDGMHTGSAEMTKAEADAILQQFVALGYIDPPDDDSDRAVTQTRRELQWNLARSHLHAGELYDAIPILEKLVEESPERRDFTITLANCLQYCGLLEESEQLILAALPDDQQNEAVLHTLSELALRNGDTERALEYLKKLEALDQKERASGAMLTAGRYLTLGATCSKLRDWTRAIKHYRHALRVDPELARAHLGIAHAQLRLKKFEAAVDAALSAVELEHQLGNAHLVLAIALLRSGRIQRAIDAGLVALRYQPSNEHIHRVLAIAYQMLPGFEDKATQHRQMSMQLRRQKQQQQGRLDATHNAIRQRVQHQLQGLKDFYQQLDLKESQAAEAEAGATTRDAAPQAATLSDPFVIVSGLPRSGTSLMMQMLMAGGMDVMTDGERVADEDNPEGYLEWEAIKKIKSQPELLEQAKGKVTKVISMLLPSLPMNQHYKVVFVLRPVEEVVASQKKMIRRRGTQGAELDTDQLVSSLTRHRDEILRLLPQLPMEVLFVRYHRILQEPEYVVERIVEFLGEDALPFRENMASAVRRDLYRNRVAEEGQSSVADSDRPQVKT